MLYYCIISLSDAVDVQFETTGTYIED
jgi:hypothetical protein